MVYTYGMYYIVLNDNYKAAENMKKIIPFAIGSILFCLTVCTPKGALTPGDAFSQLRRAYFTANSGEIVRLLSKDSKAKIRKMCLSYKNMREKQQKSLARHFDIPVNKIQNLSVKDYIQFFLLKDINRIIKKQDMHVERINRKNNQAVVYIKNGIELKFVKEGPYWKFDLTDF